MFSAIFFTPVLAEASFASFVTSLFDNSTSISQADSAALNSQTMPLLEPAVNIDPNPANGGGGISIVDESALAADQGPSGTDADTEENPSSSQISIYTVRNGDNLSEIAHMFGVTSNTIIWANDLSGNTIQPGQQLIILPITGLRHTVVAGETVASLAKKYKGDVNDIAQFNNIDASSTLAVGSVVIIPNGQMSISPGTSVSSSHAVTISKIAAGATEPYLGGSGPAIPGYFGWPLDGGVITQGLHGWNAVDIGAPKGTAIYAAAAGTVIVAKYNGAWNGGYGNYVVVQHPNGTQTLYAHMSSVIASVGDQVVQGQTIGRVGMTGEATGNHLHFEVRGAANPFASY